jgi:hypothetical protein
MAKGLSLYLPGEREGAEAGLAGLPRFAMHDPSSLMNPTQRLPASLPVIPGRDEVASPESITTIVSVDSGPARFARIPQ